MKESLKVRVRLGYLSNVWMCDPYQTSELEDLLEDLQNGAQQQQQQQQFGGPAPARRPAIPPSSSSVAAAGSSADKPAIISTLVQMSDSSSSSPPSQHRGFPPISPASMHTDAATASPSACRTCAKGVCLPFTQQALMVPDQFSVLLQLGARLWTAGWALFPTLAGPSFLSTETIRPTLYCSSSSSSSRKA